MPGLLLGTAGARRCRWGEKHEISAREAALIPGGHGCAALHRSKTASVGPSIPDSNGQDETVEAAIVETEHHKNNNSLLHNNLQDNITAIIRPSTLSSLRRHALRLMEDGHSRRGTFLSDGAQGHRMTSSEIFFPEKGVLGTAADSTRQTTGCGGSTANDALGRENTRLLRMTGHACAREARTQDRTTMSKHFDERLAAPRDARRAGYFDDTRSPSPRRTARGPLK